MVRSPQNKAIPARKSPSRRPRALSCRTSASTLSTSPIGSSNQPALRSHFQPIFSLAHRRVVGHEALLRATSAEGVPISPKDLFASCTSIAETAALDAKCRSLHACNFAKQEQRAEWLFLNVDASLFIEPDGDSAAMRMQQVCEDSGLLPHQIVIEILEDAILENAQIEQQTSTLANMGFSIAIDDFGAGHSNFDRVFNLRPTIVKLDRCVILRASLDRSVRRLTTQMVSLLHECGALVLVEGIERREEALVALDSDADLVQGYYFGLPASSMIAPNSGHESLDQIWTLCDERLKHERHAYLSRVAPYVSELSKAADLIDGGMRIADACAKFLALENVDVCFLLDEGGYQIGRSLLPQSGAASSVVERQFSALKQADGACWSRRQYFRLALENPGKVQVSRPYLAMLSRHLCVTASVCLTLDGEKLVLCADVSWPPPQARPDFARTDFDNLHDLCV